MFGAGSLFAVLISINFKHIEIDENVYIESKNDHNVCLNLTKLSKRNAC